MKIHTEFDQNSVEWMICRAGKVCASEVDALVSPLGKVRDSEGVDTYVAQKLVEMWTGGPLPSLQGIFDMEQGQILEERARPAFTIHTGIEVETAAFIETDDGRCGCSPDAIIVSGTTGAQGGVEIKCPTMPVHVRYLLDGKLPKQYVAQVQFSMWVTGFTSWHFFAYNRQFPPLHLLVERDPKFQYAISIAVESFLKLLDHGMKRLEKLNGGPPKRTPIPIQKPASPPIELTPYSD